MAEHETIPDKSVTQGTYSLKQLYFYLTEGCNLACRHCWLAPKFDPGADRYATLPLELFETAVICDKTLAVKSNEGVSNVDDFITLSTNRSICLLALFFIIFDNFRFQSFF